MIAPASRLAGLRPLLASIAFCLIAGAVGAQQVTAPNTEPPPIPEGPGVVAGRVVHPTDPSRTAGIPVVLYGLSREGAPGLANTSTDAQGRFRFEGVSTDEGMAYLVGAKYGEIPFFGPSSSFASGLTELEVVVDVADPTADGSGVSVEEVIVQVEWVGGKLAVQELHRVRNASGTVVLVDEARRSATTPAPFVAQLPSGASDFLPMAMGFEDAYEEKDGRVRYWGPIYPGGQDVRFQYLLPARDEDTPVALRLPMGGDRLSVLTASDGPKIVDTGGLIAAEDIELDGRRFEVLRASDLERGAEIVFAVGVAVTSDDIRRLSTPRADLWLELDDTQLVATQNIELRVEGGERLASRGDDPLLRFALPRGAEVLDMSPETRSLGIRFETNAGGDAAPVAEIRGPIPPGDTTLRLRYRVPATPEGAGIRVALPAETATLNVLVADTGVEIQTDRLHRRRPFRQGTRTYLHREAFQLASGETIELGLRPIVRKPLSSTATTGIAVAGVGLALAFLLAPLRARRGDTQASAESGLAMRREAIYQDILDLDHDFETGKLDEADHRMLRAELRSQVADLIEQERRLAGPTSSEGTGSRSAPSARTCPGCAEPIEAAWTFCSHCGAKLAAAPAEGASDTESAKQAGSGA